MNESEARRLANEVGEKLADASEECRYAFVQELREYFCLNCGSDSGDWCCYDPKE